MARSALDSVLNTVKSGIKAVYSATPPGQLASSIGRAGTLMAPTVADLSNAYNQTYQGVSQFVQQNPTPASFVARQAPQTNFQPIQNAYQAAQQFIQNNPIPVQYAVPKIQAQLPKLQSAYSQQLQQLPEQVATNTFPILKVPGMVVQAQKENAELAKLQTKRLKGLQLTPQEKQQESQYLANIVIGATAPPIPSEGASLGIESTRAYATYLKGLKKYGIPESANSEQIGNAFEQAIGKAEGNISAVKNVLKDFKILDRIKPETVIRNVGQAVDWYKSLLPKAQIPSPNIETPPTVTTEAQKPIVDMGPLTKWIESRYGKTIKNIPRVQFWKAVSEVPNTAIPHDYELLNKIANPRMGIDPSTVKENRPALLWGGIDRHVFTDGYTLIADPGKADLINTNLIEEYKKGLVKEIMKKDPSLSLKEAQDSADTVAKEKIDKFKTENYPPYEKIIPKDPGLLAVTQGYYFPGFPAAVLTNGQNQAVVNLDKFGYLKKLFPNAEVRFTDPLRPISFVENGQIKALLMPVNANQTGLPFPLDYQPQSPQQESVKPKYDYQSTQLDLPPEVGQEIQKFGDSIPVDKLSIDPKTGMGGIERDPHVTVVYGLDKKVLPDQLKQILANEPPITLTLGKTSLFEQPDMDVLKVDVTSPQLDELNKKIKDAIGAPGETFKEYKPHVTIAYLKKGEGKAYEGNNAFEGQTIQLNNLTFSGQNGEKTVIPLMGQMEQAPQDVIPSETPPTVTTEAQAAPVETIPQGEIVEPAASTSITSTEQPTPQQISGPEQTTQEVPKEAPKAKVDFTANDIELYNRIYTTMGQEMFKETHKLGYKGGSYTMKKLSQINEPTKVDPEKVKEVIHLITSGQSFMPSHIEEGTDGKFDIVSRPETYAALKELGYKFMPAVDATGRKGVNTNWDEGEYNYNEKPYRDWNASGAGPTYQEPPQPPPPKPKPIKQIVQESRKEEMMKDQYPKFFSLWDKVMFQIASNLRPAKALDKKVAMSGGLTSAEYEFMMNVNRVPAYQEEASQEIEKALRPVIDKKTGRFSDDAELYLRAQQYIYRESVLLKRAEKMMSSTDPTVVEKGKQMVEDVRMARMNEGNQTAESAQAELDALKERVGEKRFAQIEKSINKDLSEIMMKAFKFLHDAGMVKDETYEEIMNRKEGQYAPYKVVKYLRDNPVVVKLDRDGNPIKTMWGTEEFQTNPMVSTIKYILNAYKIGWQNIANRELYEASKFVPEFVSPVKPHKPPPPNSDIITVHVDGKRKDIYVPKEITRMYEFAPMPDEMKRGIVRWVLRHGKLGFTFFVTGTRIPFAVVNFLNDTWRLATISRYGVTFANPFATARFIVDSLNGVFQSALGNLPIHNIKVLGKEMNLMPSRYAELEKRGILGGTFTSILKDIYRGNNQEYYLKPKTKYNKMWRFINESLTYISNTLEEASKVIGDIRAERTTDPLAVRDVEVKRYAGSPNFRELGLLVRNENLNVAFPFLNPAIQGTRLDVGRLTEGGVKGSADSRRARMRVLVNLIVPTILIYAWQQQEPYKEEIDKEKANNPQLFQNNLIFPLPFKGTRPDGTYGLKYIAFPLKDVNRNIAALINDVLDIIQKKNPQAIEDIIYRSFTNWLPVDTNWSTLSDKKGFLEKAKTIGKDLTFAGLAASNPLIRGIPEQIANLKFYPRTPIVSGYLEKSASGEQFNPTTPLVYRKIGESTGISPVRLQYLGEQMGGSQITDIAKYFSAAAYGQATALPITNQLDALAQDPIGRRFYGVMSGEDKQTTDLFYKTVNDIDTLKQTYKRISERDNNEAKAEEYLKAHPEIEYADEVAKLKRKMDDLTSESRKNAYDITKTPEERALFTKDINDQKKDLYLNFSDILNQINEIKGTATPTKTSLLNVASAAEYTPPDSPIVKLQTATTMEDKIREIKSIQSKFKDVSDAMDTYIESGRDSAKARVEKAIAKSGFGEKEARYAYWTDQNEALRRTYIDDAINGATNKNDLLSALGSLREVSPITNKPILTENLIADLTDEGLITKYEAKQLRAIKTGLENKLKLTTSGGSSGSSKAYATKLRTLTEARNKAAYKPVPLKKTAPPKLKLSNLTITGSKRLKAPSLGTTGRLKFKLPQIAKFKIPKRFKGFV